MLNDLVAVIAHTERDEEIRIISMRKATKNEQSSSGGTKDSQTDWQEIATMRDEDINLSDIPEITHDQIARAQLLIGRKLIPKGKVRVNIFLDAKVVAYFKTQAGEGVIKLSLTKR